MKIQALIPSAGVGLRLKSEVSKPLVLLGGKPLFVHAIETFEKSSLIESIILVVDKENIPAFEKIIEEYKFSKVARVIAGGQTRCESVSNGLQSVDEDTDIVVVHDAARPLVSLDIVEKAIIVCYEASAVIVAVPVKPTIKRVNLENSCIEATLDRRLLWEAQTPQVFQKDIIFRAHDEIKDKQATDDACLVERLGEQVKVIEGEYKNIKITTQEDLIIAEALLKS